MEVTFYNKMDPRRLLDSTFKDLPALAPLLSQDGEQVIINSQTNSIYNGIIPVNRDVEITGKFQTSFILHGNINFILRNADVTNASNSVTTIILANDFTGTLTVEHSKVYAKSQGLMQGNLYAIMTQLGGSNSSKALEVDFANSYLQGVGLISSRLKLIGQNTIASTSKKAISVINCTKIIGDENSNLMASNLTLMQSSAEYSNLNKLTVIDGPVTLEGRWKIFNLEVNANRTSQSLFQLVGRHFSSSFDIKTITIVKAPKGISVVYAENTELIFSQAKLGSEKIKYNFAIKGCVIRMHETTDYLNWVITDKNVLELDDSSLTSLRTQKNKFYQRLSPIKSSEDEQASQVQSNEPNVDSVNIDNQNEQNNAEFDESDTSKQSATSQAGLPGINANNDTNTDENSKGNNTEDIKRVDPMSKLNSLIGLKEVKRKVKDYINTATINHEMEKRGMVVDNDMSRHMIMAGNPGTGKTTVARLLGQILYEKGAIRTGKTVSVSAKDLISDHIGGTSKETSKVIESALGGILFIDEAYALNADESKNSFAKDAVNILIQGMENHRGDLIVIFAGYTNDMLKFLKTANPGLRSRIGDNWINFPDYSYSEELQIFDLIMHEKGLQMNPAYKNTGRFKNNLIYYNRDHSNARSVRNYIDALIRIHSTRLVNLAKANRVSVSKFTNAELNTITKVDISQLYDDWHRRNDELKQISKNSNKNMITQENINKIAPNSAVDSVNNNHFDNNLTSNNQNNNTNGNISSLIDNKG